LLLPAVAEGAEGIAELDEAPPFCIFLLL